MVLRYMNLAEMVDCELQLKSCFVKEVTGHILFLNVLLIKYKNCPFRPGMVFVDKGKKLDLIFS